MKEKIKKIFNHWRTYLLRIGKNSSNHQVREINLKELRKGFLGKEFRELIRYHIQRQKPEEISAGIVETINMLNPIENEVGEEVIDYFNIQAYSKEFWGKDCEEVFNEITSMAKGMVEERRGKATDERLFNIFNIIVLNFALMAYEQKKFRDFIGIKKQKSQKRLDDIYYLLVMAGAGEDIASRVTSDENLLSKYETLEQKGCNPLEIAVIMQDLVMGNEESYLEAINR